MTSPDLLMRFISECFGENVGGGVDGGGVHSERVSENKFGFSTPQTRGRQPREDRAANSVA